MKICYRLEIFGPGKLGKSPEKVLEKSLNLLGLIVHEPWMVNVFLIAGGKTKAPNRKRKISPIEWDNKSNSGEEDDSDAGILRKSYSMFSFSLL